MNENYLPAYGPTHHPFSLLSGLDRPEIKLGFIHFRSTEAGYGAGYVWKNLVGDLVYFGVTEVILIISKQYCSHSLNHSLLQKCLNFLTYTRRVCVHLNCRSQAHISSDVMFLYGEKSLISHASIWLAIARLKHSLRTCSPQFFRRH